MINALSGLGYGIIGLAIVIGIGIVILASLGSNVANCSTAVTNGAYNVSGGTAYCSNTTVSTALGSGTATVNINTLSGYLGTSSGGLASWVPIIIVIVIGMLFLGMFMGEKGKQS